MRPRRWDPRIHVFPTVTSTQDTILEAGEAGEPEGLTHIARSQTRGRGRGTRVWFSPPGAGLWMSTLLRPTRNREFWGALSLLEACAARDALSDIGVRGVEVYWPNDLCAGGKKLGGVLGDVRSRGERAWVALGIGINIDFERPEVRRSLPPEILAVATSLVGCGAPSTLDPVEIGRAVLARFGDLYGRFEAGEDVLGPLGATIAHVGRRVEVRVEGQSPWEGAVHGLGPRGELLVRVEGRVAAVLAGEVRYAT